ncbi:5419_t:CDS:2 [Paraglomus brasilianum]|uniref:5419_t:CDS:1 n=1 Tax=Paraglomus brasilianum TaxID=144538 RepID=A0A9N9BAM8_9GLOM|nr:5419_t:CDS:2 [Paraglomus brasilianum]
MFGAIRSQAFRQNVRQAYQKRHFVQSSPILSRFLDLAQSVRSTYPISEITTSELNSSLSSPDKPIIIDVREKDEQVKGVIPGAITIPRGVLERDVERLAGSVDELNDKKDKKVVLYCAGGVRSLMAAESLIRLGYKKENIFSLEGGYQKWEKAGFDVEQYGKK